MNRLEGPYRRPTAEPRVVRAPHRPEGGGEAQTPREHERTHTQRTRGADPKGSRTEPAERTDRMEWRTGRRREGTPGRDNPQHAPRGTRGQGGAQGETQEPAPAPTPQASPGRRAHTTRALHSQGSSSTQCYAPAPRLGSLRASPWGSHWQQASSPGPAAPAARATTHQGGGVVGKRLQPRLLSDALTGEWRNGEAGEGQGSEPREPGGLRHQAGGVS